LDMWKVEKILISLQREFQKNELSRIQILVNAEKRLQKRF
jgi:hypothetical protein